MTTRSIEPLHLLSGLVAQREGVVPPLLAELGVRPEALAADIEECFGQFPKVSGVSQQFLSPATNDLLKGSFDEAGKFKDEYVSTEHVFFAIAALAKDPPTSRVHCRTGPDPAQGHFHVQVQNRRRDVAADPFTG